MRLLQVSVYQDCTPEACLDIIIFGIWNHWCHCRSHCCHSSAPLALGDRRESIVLSRYQDFVCGTMVSHVLNRMHALASLVHLICLPVRDSPSTRLWSVASGVLCMLHHTSGHGKGCDECRLMWYPESLEKPRCHTDAGCATVDNSSYALHHATSVRYCTSWTMFAESGISVPYRYWLNILALGLSRTTDDSSEIWWGWTSSRVTISVYVANSFCLLSVERLLAVDLSIAAFVVNVITVEDHPYGRWTSIVHNACTLR